MLPELWQQEARKLGGEALVGTIVELRNGQREILNRLDKMDDRHSASEAALAAVNHAFPSGDTEGHRRYHEEMIERTSEVRRLRVAIQEKTISGLVWAAIVAIGTAMYNQIKTGMWLGR